MMNQRRISKLAIFLGSVLSLCVVRWRRAAGQRGE